MKNCIKHSKPESGATQIRGYQYRVTFLRKEAAMASINIWLVRVRLVISLD
jgi:hypothetical protein